MRSMHATEKIKLILDPKKAGIKARIFVTREDGITVYDSSAGKDTSSVGALVSGVWQASEALMGLVKQDNEPLNFRLGFDTSSEGIYLFPVVLSGKKYFLGAIYQDCLNPGLLKRQVALIKEEMDQLFLASEDSVVKPNMRQAIRPGYLFEEITDEEIDRLFSAGGF